MRGHCQDLPAAGTVGGGGSSSSKRSSNKEGCKGGGRSSIEAQLGPHGDSHRPKAWLGADSKAGTSVQRGS